MDYPQLSDEELSMLCGKGDDSATDELLRRFSPTVRYYANRYSGRAFDPGTALDCDDYYQYGLLGLCSATVAFRPDRNTGFRTYATTCIINAMRTAARKHGAKKHGLIADISIEEIEIAADDGSSPESEYLTAELMNEIENLISTVLTDTERQVLQEFIGGKSYKEIALATGKTTKAVDGALQRARRKIAAKIGET